MPELPIPPDAAGDSRATEVLRVWIVGQELHCSLQSDAFPDPATWGAVLADVLRHVATAVHEQEGKDALKTIQSILAELQAEVNAPEEEPPT